MSLGDIFERLKDAVTGNDHEQQQQTYQDQGFGNVLPASQDPYGDPADQQASYNNYNDGGFGNVLPASQDPLGDPADQEMGNGYNNDVLPASMDPLGDPADEYDRRR